jgi:hypothetical protein
MTKRALVAILLAIAVTLSASAGVTDREPYNAQPTIIHRAQQIIKKIKRLISSTLDDPTIPPPTPCQCP